MNEKLLFNKYRVKKLIYSSDYSKIYEGFNEREKEKVAIKFEKEGGVRNSLESEAFYVFNIQGFGIPKFITYGKKGSYKILIEELLGMSIYDLYKSKNNKQEFRLKNTYMLALQMINRLEYIHSKNIIHRDIKPDNFVLGRGEKCKNLYILDFGLAKKYRSSRTLKHYPMIKKKNLTGTARYASINALNGLTQSRRDDLEAVGYVLLYFLRGKLPWQGIHVKKKEDRYHRIMEIKMETSPKDLCEGFPQEFESYVKYCRELEYKEDPDYNYLKKLFNNVLKDYSENTFDWDKTIITATTSSTSKKCTNMEKNIEKQKNKNIYSEKFMSAFNNPNYSTINSKEVITNTFINKKNTQIHSNIINTSNDYEDLAEFTEEENIKKKLPNAFSKIHNKQQLEKSFELSMKKDNNFCVII